MAQKWLFSRYIAEAFKNDSSWPKNHFFTIITPKPAYIYSHNFLREIFSKKIFWSHGTPLGYLGSLSRDPLGRIFSKCVFLNLLSPLGLPIPSNAMVASKKLKNFPRGCGLKRKKSHISQKGKAWYPMAFITEGKKFKLPSVVQAE